MIVVTFKNSYDETVCMFARRFKTVEDAKRNIEKDGKAFADAHSFGKFKQSSKWVDPKNRDFFKVVGKDGHSCIWQYFGV